jgi:hypothetical protein
MVFLPCRRIHLLNEQNSERSGRASKLQRTNRRQQRLALNLRRWSKYRSGIALRERKSCISLRLFYYSARSYMRVREVVEVPEDSPEVKKWPIWRTQDEISQPSASTSSVAEEPTAASAGVESTAPSTPAAARTTPPAGKRPGPRKPKAQLAELPGRGATKAKKLTTLDKSVMDWKAHVQSSESAGLQDELEANRRGGGYLEKVDFLQRVEERKDAVFEAAKAGKRRRT